MTLVSLPPKRSVSVRPGAETGPQRRLSVHVIGGLMLDVSGTVLPLAGRKARAVLAFTALESQRAPTRERLAGLFWGDSSERHARNSLRQTLFTISESLEATGCPVLQRHRDEIGLDRNALTIDLEAALQAIAAGQIPDTLSGTSPGVDALLAGYEDLSSEFGVWIATTRRLAHNRLLRALEQVYDDETRPAALRRRFAEAALHIDSLHEGACRTVMQLAAVSGEVGVALRTYAALFDTMGLQLDSEPSEPTQALVAAIKLGHLSKPAQGFAAPPFHAATNRTPTKPPVVAVLPFVPLGSDESSCLVANGISDDLVRVLSSFREPAVISSNSTRNLRPDEADLSEIGQRLGAGYLLCGSVRLIGGNGRVIVELVDALTATVLWGEAYEVEGSRIFNANDCIAAKIVHALAPRVNASELRRSISYQPADLGAYHLLLRARDLVFRLERAWFAQAGLLIAEALRREPSYPAAYAARADWLSLQIFQGWSNDAVADTASLMEAAEMAIQLDPFHARALALLGHNRMLAEHRFEEAEALVDRAVAAAPNDAEVLAWSSPTCAYIGRTEDAVRRAEQAILLSPQDPFLFRFEHFLSLAHYVSEDCEQAAYWGLKSWRRNQNYTSNLRITIAALSAIGRLEEAVPMVERHCALHPDFRSASVAVKHTFRSAMQRERFAARLGGAGLP